MEESNSRAWWQMLYSHGTKFDWEAGEQRLAVRYTKLLEERMGSDCPFYFNDGEKRFFGFIAGTGNDRHVRVFFGPPAGQYTSDYLLARRALEKCPVERPVPLGTLTAEFSYPDTATLGRCIPVLDALVKGDNPVFVYADRPETAKRLPHILHHLLPPQAAERVGFFANSEDTISELCKLASLDAEEYHLSLRLFIGSSFSKADFIALSDDEAYETIDLGDKPAAPVTAYAKAIRAILDAEGDVPAHLKKFLSCISAYAEGDKWKEEGCIGQCAAQADYECADGEGERTRSALALVTGWARDAALRKQEEDGGAFVEKCCVQLFTALADDRLSDTVLKGLDGQEDKGARVAAFLADRAEKSPRLKSSWRTYLADALGKGKHPPEALYRKEILQTFTEHDFMELAERLDTAEAELDLGTFEDLYSLYCAAGDEPCKKQAQRALLACCDVGKRHLDEEDLSKLFEKKAEKKECADKLAFLLFSALPDGNNQVSSDGKTRFLRVLEIFRGEGMQSARYRAEVWLLTRARLAGLMDGSFGSNSISPIARARMDQMFKAEAPAAMKPESELSAENKSNFGKKKRREQEEPASEEFTVRPEEQKETYGYGHSKLELLGRVVRSEEHPVPREIPIGELIDVVSSEFFEHIRRADSGLYSELSAYYVQDGYIAALDCSNFEAYERGLKNTGIGDAQNAAQARVSELRRTRNARIAQRKSRTDFMELKQGALPNKLKGKALSESSYSVAAAEDLRTHFDTFIPQKLEQKDWSFMGCGAGDFWRALGWGLLIALISALFVLSVPLGKAIAEVSMSVFLRELGGEYAFLLFFPSIAYLVYFVGVIYGYREVTRGHGFGKEKDAKKGRRRQAFIDALLFVIIPQFILTLVMIIYMVI